MSVSRQLAACLSDGLLRDKLVIESVVFSETEDDVCCGNSAQLNSLMCAVLLQEFLAPGQLGPIQHSADTGLSSAGLLFALLELLHHISIHTGPAEGCQQAGDPVLKADLIQTTAAVPVRCWGQHVQGHGVRYCHARRAAPWSAPRFSSGGKA